jgi:transposase
MRTFKRVHQLNEEEHGALLQGTKSRSGFTMRRSHILLLSDEGLTPQQIAQRLHCGDQTVRNVIRAFEREGVGCLEQKSSRPQHDNSTFNAEGLQRLDELVHRSPRDFDGQSSLWSLAELARVCFQQGIVARPISYEAVRRALGKLGLDWRHARHHITSHDPQYERKKAAATLDRVG